MKEEVLWDPYTILDIPTTSDEKSIKKAFKKLSLIYHPDKLKAADKEAGEGKFIDISKAYKVLTDEDAKKLFDEFGHPDGKQAFTLGLALPGWLVESENNGIVLLLYTVIFGIGLPVMVANWWRNAKGMSKNEVLDETMGILYRDLYDDISLQGLLEVVTKAQEFKGLVLEGTTQEWNEYERLVSKENLFVILKKNSTNVKALMCLVGHHSRIFSPSEAIQGSTLKVVGIARKVAGGMLQITQSRNWIKSTKVVLLYTQHLVQALSFNQSSLSQLPHMTVANIAKANKSGISNIADLLDKSSTLEDIFKGDTEEVQKVASLYPRLQVLKWEYSVYGDPVIVPSSLVTLSVKFNCHYGPLSKMLPRDHEIEDPEVEKMNRKWWLGPEEDAVECHCPYTDTQKTGFSVLLSNDSIGRLICMKRVVGSREHTVRLQFQAPPETGAWTFQVRIVADCFKGTDLTFDAKLVVVDYKELPVENYDEEISEPEDNIVGYEKPEKKIKGEYDDSSDSDDFSEVESENGPTEDFVE